MKSIICSLFCLYFSFVSATQLSAQPIKALDIYGHASWGVGKTDGNKYLIGNKKLENTHSQFTILMNANPDENINYVFQITWQVAEGETNTLLEYAFVEKRFLDQFKVRAGRIRQSFGIRSEYINVGTLRPFVMLPQSIYGPNGFTGRSYNGLGITGIFVTPKNSELQYDLYWGFIDNSISTPGVFYDEQDNQNVFSSLLAFNFKIDQAVGGRLNYAHLIEGLSLGASGYAGIWDANDNEYNLNFSDYYYVGALHLEYQRYPFTFRSEILASDQGELLTQQAGYAEAEIFVTEKIETVFHFDYLELHFDKATQLLQASFIDQLLFHKDWAFGINYWVSPQLVVKAETHYVTGNRFAFPDGQEEIQKVFQTQQLDKYTNSYQFGIQFSF